MRVTDPKTHPKPRFGQRKRVTGARVKVKNDRLPAAMLSRLADTLQSGGVAIFPTETVYGIGTSAFAPSGIRKIYQLKGRRWNKPLALLVPSLEAAIPLVETIPDEAYRLAQAFWPGPMTLVLPASSLGRLVTGGLSTIGVRVPDHPIAMAILKAVGLPLATTSVNRAGENPATSGAAAAKMGAQVDWLIDGGVCSIKQASSVIDLSCFPFTVKRQGTLTKAALEKTLFKH